MKNAVNILRIRKDGGNASTVTGFFIIAIKFLFSIVLLRFDGESREAYHTHAFHCISWVIKGELKETMKDGRVHHYRPSIFPFFTSRKDFHKVSSCYDKTWVLSIRGPWCGYWLDHDENEDLTYVLTHGREPIGLI